jgi:hypothetical protein
MVGSFTCAVLLTPRMEPVWSILLHKRARQPQTSSPYQKRTARCMGGRCTSDQPDVGVETTGVDITILGRRCDANSLSEELAFRSSRSVAMRELWIAKENRAGGAGGKAEMSRSRRVLAATWRAYDCCDYTAAIRRERQCTRIQLQARGM